MAESQTSQNTKSSIPKDSNLVMVSNELAPGITIQLGKRSLQVAKLIPRTLEGKRGYSGVLNRLKISPLQSFLIEVLYPEHIQPTEAVKLMIANEKQLFQERENLPNLSVEQTRSLYEKYSIDIQATIQETVNATRDFLKGFHLSAVTENKALAILQNLDLRFTADGGSQVPLGQRYIEIDLVAPFLDAGFLTTITRQELSGDLIKTFLAQSIAHEIAHLIDQGLAPESGFGHLQNVSQKIQDKDADYPIKYEDYDNSPERIKDWGERFAVGFERSVVKKLALSLEAIDDFRKAYLSMVVQTLSKIPPRRLSDFMSCLQQSLPANDKRRIIMEDYLKALLAGETTSQAFPFNEEQIYEALIQAEANLESKLIIAAYKEKLRERDVVVISKK